MKELINFLLHPIIWLSSPTNRARLSGARIEVIALIACREPEPAVLLGQSHFHGLWMPPQEGVNVNETFFQALRRCLEVEFGLDLPATDKEFSRVLHVRSIRYIGSLQLPSNRQNERPIADDALGTPLEHVRLKKKAYWLAIVLVANRSQIQVTPDGKEITDLRWFSLSESRNIILKTNSEDKAALLMKCLDACEQALHGARRE